jgi:plasmid stabilization system protein ParE
LSGRDLDPHRQRFTHGGGQVLDVMLGIADSLSLFSSRGRVVPELLDDTIREVFVYRYRLIYQVHNEEIRILAIIHGAMDFERWLRGSR